MPNCCVVTCKNRSETKNYKNNGVTYHIFPKNPNIKEKWIDATGRGPNWFPVRRSVICSDHFQEKCFQVQNKSRRLFEWAIPTVKICHIVSTDISKPTPTLRQSTDSDTDNLEEKDIKPDFTFVTCDDKIIPLQTNEIKQAASAATDVTVSTSSNTGVEIPTIVPKRSSSPLPEGSNETFETPREYEMRLKINKYQSMLNKQKTQIKTLQKKNTRYQKKISKLEDLLNELNEKRKRSMQSKQHTKQIN